MSKTLWLGLVLIFVASTNVFAEFRADEKPIWGMMEETAYTLKGGEWNIDLWGPVTGGVVDGFQLGSMFWIWFGQIPNMNAKINIIAETDTFPAISIGGYFGQLAWKITSTDTYNKKTETNVNLTLYGLSAHVSKQLSPTLYLTGVYVYNGLNASNSVSGDDDWFISVTGASSSSKLAASLISDLSKVARCSLEAALNLGDKPTVNAGGGFEWAMGESFRLKLGVYTALRDSRAWYIPFVDFHWRFK